jgi:hypothetical protein
LSILAAMEIERLANRKPGEIWRIGASFSLLIAVLLVAWFCLRRPADKSDYVLRQILLAGAFLIGGVLFAWLSHAGILRNRWAATAWIVLLAVDAIFLFGRPLLSSVKPALFYPSNSVLDFLQPRCAPDWRALFVGEGFQFPPNLDTYYRIPGIRGYDAMTPARYRELQRRVGDFEGNIQAAVGWNDRLIDLLGVRYIVSEKPRLTLERAVQTLSNTPAGEITGAHRFGQTFRATDNGLLGVSVSVGTYGRHNDKNLRLLLKEAPDSETILRTANINDRDLIDNGFADFYFEPIPDSAGRSFYFEIDSPDSTPGHAVTLWAFESPTQDAYPEGALFVDGHATTRDARFSVLYRDAVREKYPVVHHSSGMWVFENADALPRAFFVPEAKAIPDSKDLLDTVCRPDFDFRNCALLEDRAALWPAEPAPTPSSGTTQARITQNLPCDIRIATDAPTNGYLVLTDNYYPGWNAQVDDLPQPLYRADYAFRAVRVPAGRHAVRFIYSPSSFWLCAWISGTLWACWLGGVIWALRRRKFIYAKVNP